MNEQVLLPSKTVLDFNKIKGKIEEIAKTAEEERNDTILSEGKSKQMPRSSTQIYIEAYALRYDEMMTEKACKSRYVRERIQKNLNVNLIIMEYFQD